jgi:hypothetical protein
VLFIYRFPPDRFVPPIHGELGAWYGRNRKGDYDAVTLTFFKSVRDVRKFIKSWSPGGSLARNVIVGSKRRFASGGDWRNAVRSCLRAEAAADGNSPPKRQTPRASLATFAGLWVGHTRSLGISTGGRGVEGASSGCCHRLYSVTFQILSVSGTLTRATAAYRVTSFRRYELKMTRLRVGQVGRLRLRNGIVSNNLTDDAFCSGPASAATGFCGA